jgi:hypothetical protein
MLKLTLDTLHLGWLDHSALFTPVERRSLSLGLDHRSTSGDARSATRRHSSAFRVCLNEGTYRNSETVLISREFINAS